LKLEEEIDQIDLNIIDQNRLKSVSNSKKDRAGSLARLGHLLDVNINWSDFKQWTFSKYAKSYAPTVYCYAKKYAYMINGNLRDLDTLSESVRNQTIKSLITLSKYWGAHTEFKKRLNDYGIKVHRPSSFNSFLRILKSNNSNITKWYNNTLPNLRSNERTFLRFVLYSGMRKTEAIRSFNLIIELHRDDRLCEYYSKLPKSETKCLQHFKYHKMFLRNTKNVFISFIPEELINEIANSKHVTYPMIIKRMHRNKVKCRINELRDYYGTYLLHHGLLEQEVNLLQGRIPPSIFIKHYWSPKLSELRDRTLKAIRVLEQSL